MGQITRETCRCILEAFERKDPDGGFPLTSWEKAQLAYAWLEREDARASPEVKQTPYGPAIRGDVLIDAERYRWLRAGNYPIDFARSVLNDIPQGIDAAVDKAMKQETPK